MAFENDYKIDAEKGFSIPLDKVSQTEKEGFNLWKSYFENTEGLDEEKAIKMSKLAQKLLSIGPSNMGLSKDCRNLLEEHYRIKTDPKFYK